MKWKECDLDTFIDEELTAYLLEEASPYPQLSNEVKLLIEFHLKVCNFCIYRLYEIAETRIQEEALRADMFLDDFPDLNLPEFQN